MCSVPSGCIGIHRLKFIRRDRGSFSGGLLLFLLSAAVIALNAF